MSRPAALRTLGSRSRKLQPLSRHGFTTNTSAADNTHNKNDFHHCVQLVQGRDRDGWLCGLLLPASWKQPYYAIRALNAELATVPKSKSDHALQLRMQWWRDAVAELYKDNDAIVSSGSSSSSPVVRQLAIANKQCQFTRRFLERLIDARENDLSKRQYQTVDELILYAEDSVSSILYLTLECADVSIMIAVFCFNLWNKRERDLRKLQLLLIMRLTCF
jgi:phytoene/squalene synthetase